MKKKAFINIILLGFILITSVIVFLSTTSDDIVWKNKYFNLKKITDSTALALAKSYKINYNETKDVDDAKLEATNIADAMLTKTNLGIDAHNYMEPYNWCFKGDGCTLTQKCQDDDSCKGQVRVTITDYNHKNFWYKFIGKDNFIFSKIESIGNIVISSLPDIPESDEFMPFAINECGKGEENIIPGASFSFIYKPYAIYDANESTGFYGLDTTLNADGVSQSDFAAFKNVIDKFYDGEESIFNIDTKQYLVDSPYDESAVINPINNDASQLSSSLEVKKFDEPFPMAIALLDCASTKDNIIVKNLIEVTMTNVYCGDKSTDASLVTDAFVDQSEDVFDEDITWITWTESYDCSSSGLLRIDITIDKVPDEDILE